MSMLVIQNLIFISSIWKKCYFTLKCAHLPMPYTCRLATCSKTNCKEWLTNLKLLTVKEPGNKPAALLVEIWIIFQSPEFWSSDRQTDGQKAMHKSPPCISTGVLKKQHKKHSQEIILKAIYFGCFFRQPLMQTPRTQVRNEACMVAFGGRYGIQIGYHNNSNKMFALNEGMYVGPGFIVTTHLANNCQLWLWYIIHKSSSPFSS